MKDLEPNLRLSSIPVPKGLIQKDPEMVIENEEPLSDSTLPRQSFYGLLRKTLMSNYKTLPKRLLKDVYWLAPLGMIWMIIWPMKFMTLYSLPDPFYSMTWGLIFLTATYNGFIGKAAFITVISRTIIPMIKRIKAGELAQIKSRYMRTFTMLKNLVAKGKNTALKVFLLSGGFGLIASNILTRNNKIDKYLVCVLCAFALIDDLSKGSGNPVIRLVSTGLRDLPLLAAKNLKVSMQTTYLSITGFAMGLLAAFLPGMFANSFYSPVGAIAGFIAIGAGLVLHFKGGKNAGK